MVVTRHSPSQLSRRDLLCIHHFPKDSQLLNMASVSETSLRTLKIKTAVVERISKELDSYYAELEDNKKTVEEIRRSDDHSKLKQMENVLGETQCMIPDTMTRLTNAVDDLSAMLDASNTKALLAGTPELNRAMTAISTASKKLES